MSSPVLLCTSRHHPTSTPVHAFSPLPFPFFRVSLSTPPMLTLALNLGPMPPKFKFCKLPYVDVMSVVLKETRSL